MCFVAGTKVKTFDGDKNIEDIEAGDYVFSKNTETGETGYKLVEEVFQNETPEIIRLEIAGEVIETTANHPFWVSGYGFKNAGFLKTGDVIETIDGNLYPVLSAERFYPTEDVKVYNFRVADWHTYYVSEIGILVHNDKCGPDVARRSESGSDFTKYSPINPCD